MDFWYCILIKDNKNIKNSNSIKIIKIDEKDLLVKNIQIDLNLNHLIDNSEDNENDDRESLNIEEHEKEEGIQILKYLKAKLAYKIRKPFIRFFGYYYKN